MMWQEEERYQCLVSHRAVDGRGCSMTRGDRCTINSCSGRIEEVGGSSLVPQRRVEVKWKQ